MLAFGATPSSLLQCQIWNFSILERIQLIIHTAPTLVPCPRSLLYEETALTTASLTSADMDRMTKRISTAFDCPDLCESKACV